MKSWRNQSKIGWTTEQQSIIKKLRDEEGLKSWKKISKKLDNLFETNRTPKQCRERYMNFIKFSDEKFANSIWTLEQDKLLFDSFLKNGSKWRRVVCDFSGRSENNLKNRFYGLIRKAFRKLQKAQMINRVGQKKLLKTQTLLNILEASGKLQALGEINTQKYIQFSQLVFQLRQKILHTIINQEEQQQIEELTQIVHKIYQFISFIKVFRQVMKQSAKSNNDEIAQAQKKGDKLEQEQKIIQLQMSSCFETDPEKKEWKTEQENNRLMFWPLDMPKCSTGNKKQLQQQFCQMLQIQYKPAEFPIFLS